MSFHLKCDDEVLSFIVAEAAAAGCSRTAYINQVLTALFQVPTFLTRGNRLQELTACSKLFNEETMRDLPSLAKKERRYTDQMLLWLVDEGIRNLERRSSALTSQLPTVRTN